MSPHSFTMSANRSALSAWHYSRMNDQVLTADSMPFPEVLLFISIAKMVSWIERLCSY